MTGRPDDGGRHWSALGAEVPGDLAGVRVLDVGSAGGRDRSSAALDDRGAAAVVRCELPGDLDRDLGGEFGLVYCRGSLQLDPHPMNLLTRLWHLTGPEAVLLLESRILTAPEQSRYGRFVAAEGGGSPSHWLPGRLALRWMVEVSGFDVDRWLPAPDDASAGPDQVSAYLRGTRADRQPALDLATPAPSEQDDTPVGEIERGP